MANTPVVVLDDTLTDIADAIRSKNNTQSTYKPGQMAAAITAIPTGGIGIPREVSPNGVYQRPSSSFTFSLPSNAVSVGAYALQDAFAGTPGLTAADLSSLVTVSTSSALQGAFTTCINLKTVDFSSLTTVSGLAAFQDAFTACTKLKTVDLSSLRSVTGQRAFKGAFEYNIALTSIDLSSLEAIDQNSAFEGAFESCSSLSSVDLSSLRTIDGYNAMDGMFRYCTSLTTLSFPALTASSFGIDGITSQFHNMLEGVTGCTVHFPAVVQSVIGNWADVQNGFGGTNTTVLFDL